MNLPVINIHNASFSYATQVIFKHIDLTLPPGQWVGLLGPSGVGKSTLLRMIAGLLSPSASTRITASNHESVATQIAYMAQTDLLLPWMSVIDNALLSIKLHPSTHPVRLAKIKQANALLEAVGLSNTAHLYPDALSGGMRQRVALVRTLLMDKPIILMDEPFSALDAITRYQLQALAVDILRNKTVLFITHDPQEALRLANIIYVMKGKPATLKTVATLTSPIPRPLDSPEVTALQAALYQELTMAAEVQR